jgi:hypothetical protein
MVATVRVVERKIEATNSNLQHEFLRPGDLYVASRHRFWKDEMMNFSILL